MRAKYFFLVLLVVGCNKVPEPTSPVAQSKPKKADLELQEQCAKQAREEFKQAGWDKDSNFTNHYNEKLNRCFMLIEKTDAKLDPGTIWRTKILADAYEGRTIGLFSWHTEKGKKYWEVPPFQCEMMPPSGEKAICKSEAEFDEFVKTYME
jgi:hypothetical protein